MKMGYLANFDPVHDVFRSGPVFWSRNPAFLHELPDIIRYTSIVVMNPLRSNPAANPIHNDEGLDIVRLRAFRAFL